MVKLQAALVIEILGKPPEHITEGLQNLITKMGDEKGVKIIEKTLHDAVPVQEGKDLFTNFAEVTVEVDNVDTFFKVLFAYMPSHAELIHPEKIQLSNIELHDIGNKILARLHEYDAITKTVVNERQLMAQELQKYAPHLFKQKDDVGVKSAQGDMEKGEVDVKKEELDKDN